MKINLKKDWKFLSIITIVVILIMLLATYTAEIKNKFYTKGERQEATGVVENIEIGTEIIQSFQATSNNLEKIVLDFEPYKDDSNCGGKVLVGIKDNEGKIIQEKEITRNYVREKTQYTLEFQKQKDSAGKQYTIYIKFNDLEKAERFYTLKMTNDNQFTENKLYINGEEQPNSSLIFQEFNRSNIRIAIFVVVLGLMIIGVYMISFIIYYKKDLKIETIFLMITPFVCLFFLITMPTFKNHDEYYHWVKAYEVSQGNLMTPVVDGVQGSMMPSSVPNVCPKDWTKMNYQGVAEKLKNPLLLDKEKKEIVDTQTAAVYFGIPYIPQAVGIAMARVFTDNTYLITYAGRLTNIMVAMILLYFAIKIMPFGKKLLLIPTMIPIVIEGFSSLSPDAMTISMSFLYIAYVLQLAFGKKEKIEIKEKIILLVMSVIVALCKIVYLPLVGLILIIPKEKFKNNQNKIINFCVIAGIATIINLIWLKIANGYLSDFREGDSKIQVLLALQNPIQYLQNLLYTINLNGSKYLLSLFGTDLGWGELIKLHSVVPYFLLAIYLFTATTEEEIKNKFKTYQLVWITLVVLAIIALVFTSLYVQWTTIGEESIAGVQGRYFLPILPLIMILIGSTLKIKSSYKKENINKFVAISILVLQIYTISQIIVVHL